MTYYKVETRYVDESVWYPLPGAHTSIDAAIKDATRHYQMWGERLSVRVVQVGKQEPLYVLAAGCA